MVFVGRTRELALLREEFASDQASLVIMYGRRRVGKSTLLRESLRERPHILYQATRVTDADSQALVKAELTRVLGESSVLAGLTGWEAILSYLVQVTRDDMQAGRPPRPIVLDEFPYLCEEASALPSIVQKIWDGVRASDLPMKLVLCGSQVAFMEGLLAERNPLHGRQTRELEVLPLSYRDVVQMIPTWDADTSLRAYGILGGMPYYWSLCDPAMDLPTNVRRLVLADGAPLLEEPAHLLQAEFSAPARYASILRAIADGLTQRGEIVTRVLHAGEPSASITPYVDRLERMRLIRRTHSLDVRAPEKSRNARYYLNDQFLAFHFHYVLPNLSAIKAGHGDEVYQYRIAPTFDTYMGERLEEIAREYMTLYGQERLGVPAGEAGKIWAEDYDIDVAGTLLDGRRFAGECKWWKADVGMNVYRRLVAESGRNVYYSGAAPIFLLVARAGFTPELVAEARAHPTTLHLLMPTDLLRVPGEHF